MAKPFYNYSSITKRSRYYLTLIAIIILGIGLSVIYGMTLPITGFLGFQYALVPAILISLMGVWLMPEKDTCYEFFMQPLMLLYIICICVWPPYVSIIPLPGAIWAPPGRIILFLMTFIALVNISVSRQAKSHIATFYEQYPITLFSIIGLVTIQFCSVFFSSSSGYSMSFFLKYSMATAMAFIITISVLNSEKILKSLPYIALVILLYLSGMAFIEQAQETNLWVKYLPSWAIVDDGSGAMSRIINPIYRNGSYRVRGTSITSLEFGELFAYLSPFAYYFLFERKSIIGKLIAISCLVIAFTAALTTGARLAHVGFLFAGATYVFLWGLRGWVQDARNILGPAIAILYTTMASLVFVALFASTRLNNLAFGGAGTEASTQGRIIQWQTGFPKLLENPVFGHGMGQGASALNSITIDSYILSILLETGVIALVCFLLFFGITIATAVKMYLYHSKNSPLNAMTASIASTMAAFLLIKTILSQIANHSLIYMLAAIVFIIAIKFKQQQASEVQPNG
ncbi:O-antigen ligase [Kordiimonas sp. SCSIO 12610]|uniref:O-antigen ligase family protein n=1 Tax=Kordiimonas sp. SCSIO 12610 TaxID=2829597 RepID=UPI00210DEB29|nr:O-antigen ligase family protein [Kordiimonas sp. SCSIO 12610]UTW55880.1 O-antigen ligase family protein [Kordiimonas sp. SCSIO 12610]